MATRDSARVAKDKAVSFNSSSLLTILVGKEPNQQRFSVHEGIVCARSEFFRRAMSGNWIEKEERVVKFPEDNPATFSLYVNLIYTNVIPTSASEQPKSVEEIQSEYLVLGKLYILCEKLQDRTAKNSVARAILAVSKEEWPKGNRYSPCRDVVDIMYQGTCTGSKGRLLMAELWTTVSSEYIVSSATSLPKDFFVDLIVALRSVTNENVARHADPSRYMEKDE